MKWSLEFNQHQLGSKDDAPYPLRALYAELDKEDTSLYVLIFSVSRDVSLYLCISVSLCLCIQTYRDTEMHLCHNTCIDKSQTDLLHSLYYFSFW